MKKNEEKENLVSVIITTFKREPTMVKRAINSVLNQTHTNLEVIVVDDSPDSYPYRKNIASMVHSVSDGRIIYIQHKENKGACVARNTGIKRSSGEYIMYFDDDDELLPNKIKDSLEKFITKEVGLVYSQNYVVNDKNKRKTTNNKMVSGFVFKHLIKKNFVSAFPLVKKECFIECGLFDPKMNSKQDYEMWLRISKKYKFDYVNKPLSKVFLHNGERISNDPKKRIQGDEEIYRRYKTYLNKNRSAKNERLMSLAINYARNKEIKKAKNTWVKALKLAPFKLGRNIKSSYIILKNTKN